MNDNDSIQLDLVDGDVHNHYSNIARNILSNQDSSCCPSDENSIKRSIPSLGIDRNLLNRARPKSGEIVIDFGSGPGHDLLQIAKLVGSSGKAIGVDFSRDMIDLANKNLEEADINNVNFVQSDLTSIPLPDETADLITSNCVFNLVGNKQKAFEEAYRLLKSGGRFVISDQITHVDENTNISNDLKCGCIGGARSIEEYLNNMEQAGFDDVGYEEEYEKTVNISGQKISYSSVLFFGWKK